MLYTYSKHISKPTIKQQVKDRKSTISDRLCFFEPMAENRRDLNSLLALFHKGKVQPPPGYSLLFKGAFDAARFQNERIILN